MLKQHIGLFCVFSGALFYVLYSACYDRLSVARALKRCGVIELTLLRKTQELGRKERTYSYLQLEPCLDSLNDICYESHLLIHGSYVTGIQSNPSSPLQ